MPTAEEVKTFLIQKLGTKLAAAGIKEPADDLNMVEAGLVDSFGLLDLIVAVEQKFGVQMDMSRIDVDTLMRFGGFAELAARSD